ncbi:VOC family protein [Celerinatantimonas sp. MCCC 1A17872]|uniref:VOC family protein n=1 Tax=Celerinatantimonas sp. MCCC 1A17872 TaxID=3177514 RepID=UPI0038C33842
MFFDHLSTYAVDYLCTRDFYAALFEPFGYEINYEFSKYISDDFPHQRICSFGAPGTDSLWIVETQSPFTPRHFAFGADTTELVDTFYKIGLELGAIDNGAPGLRLEYEPNYYAAFLIDPDGNNIEAVCHA